ncbi:thaumatin [Rhodocollybia butyracea]|uniref:Thaumatin n=1 Tax=Rhodocollybia butyracea TaxID=206335 RepID=A0A9P5Q3R8_9AGAR|nr:thaumatin [Rhodocollybia butyracea]
MKLIQAAILAASTAFGAARTVTVFNGCPFTMWPAMFTGVGAAPNHATGWEAAAFTSVSFTVPDNWQDGRIWGRRNCDFSTNPGPNSCLDGGCNGGLVCDPVTGTVRCSPATLAEFTLSNNPVILDNYDVSLVDGYNLPMSITTNKGCPVASCPVDLGPDCPAALKGPFDSTGFPVGCKSACVANLDGNPGVFIFLHAPRLRTDYSWDFSSPNCCSGQFNTPATCPSSGVQFYSYFKSNCPDSFVFAFDDSGGTPLKACASTLAADYTVTFCPPA